MGFKGENGAITLQLRGDVERIGSDIWHQYRQTPCPGRAVAEALDVQQVPAILHVRTRPGRNSFLQDRGAALCPHGRCQMVRQHCAQKVRATLRLTSCGKMAQSQSFHIRCWPNPARREPMGLEISSSVSTPAIGCLYPQLRLAWPVLPDR